MTERPLYLDNAATTPLDERVLEAMLPHMKEEYGNAASRQHFLGRRAARAVETAREQLAALIGADPREIVFTSGATESNNLLLKGVAAAEAYRDRSKHFVTARTEHHALLDPLASLEQQQGFEVSRLPVGASGLVEQEALAEALARNPRLVSLMHVNNELGTIQPIEQVAGLCREAGVLFHTDASQSVGKLPIDVERMQVDALSLSGHKFYGPKGVGALYLRRKNPRVRCAPLFDGGGQEGNRRSGTLNVPGIVGLGAAAQLCASEMERESARLKQLASEFLAALQARIPGTSRNGDPVHGLPSLMNLHFQGVNAESLLARFERVCASSSSACTSTRMQPSHVLRAIGAEEARIAGSLRFSLGRFTARPELTQAVDEIARAVEAERAEGPLDLCQVAPEEA